jgi:hypothetical protein
MSVDIHHQPINSRLMWRSGGNTRLLRKGSCVRFPHSANICVLCVPEHVCLYWVWVFLCIICIHYQPNNVPTAGAQSFLMDYTRRTGHNPPRGPSAGWCNGCVSLTLYMVINSSMALRLVRFGVRSWKLSNVGKPLDA